MTRDAAFLLFSRLQPDQEDASDWEGVSLIEDGGTWWILARSRWPDADGVYLECLIGNPLWLLEHRAALAVWWNEHVVPVGLVPARVR